jgi:nucleotide-binding universal stress UspA family protein
VALAGRHLLGGEPCAAVEEVARRLRADIVVAGTVARSGLARALFGNTAEQLLRFLPCDLLILKPPEFVCRVPATQRGAQQISAIPLS